MNIRRIERIFIHMAHPQFSRRYTMIRCILAITIFVQGLYASVPAQSSLLIAPPPGQGEFPAHDDRLPLDPKQPLEKILLEESTAIDKVLGFSSAIWKSQVEQTHADPGKGLIVNLNELESYASLAKVKQLRQYIILILTHEKMHLFQAHLYPRFILTTDSEERRVFECQADIVAGKHLTEIQGEPGNASNNQAIIDALNVSHAMGSDGNSNVADHPTDEQRRTAVRLGMANGTIVNMSTKPQTPELQWMMASIAEKINLLPGESVPDWSLKTAKKIIGYNHEVAKYIVLKKSESTRNMSSDHPFIKYDYLFVNTGTRTIEIDMEFQCAWVPKRDPENTLRWQKWSVRNYRLKLFPGEQFSAKGELPWGAEQSSMPGIILTNFTPELISPTKDRNALASFQYADPPEFAAEALKLKDAINSLRSGVADNFKKCWAGGAVESAGARTYLSSVAIPKSIETRIYIPTVGPANVVASMYNGTDAAVAQTRYRDLITKFNAAFPDIPGHEAHRVDNGIETDSFLADPFPNDRCYVKVTLKKSSNGTYTITFQLVSPISIIDYGAVETKPTGTVTKSTEDRENETALQALDGLIATQYEKVRALFSPTMLSLVSSDQVAALWTGAVTTEGSYKSHFPPVRASQGGIDTVLIKCEMEKNNIIVSIVFDDRGDINGLWIRPSM